MTKPVKSKSRTRRRRQHAPATKAELLTRVKRTDAWIKRIEKRIADQQIRVAYHHLLAREKVACLSDMRADLRSQMRLAVTLMKRVKTAK